MYLAYVKSTRSFHAAYVNSLFGKNDIVEFRFTAKGKTGHASILFEDTAAEKIHKIINKLLGLRETEKARLKGNPDLDLGDVTSVNMTMLSVLSCIPLILKQNKPYLL